MADKSNDEAVADLLTAASLITQDAKADLDRITGGA